MLRAHRQHENAALHARDGAWCKRSHLDDCGARLGISASYVAYLENGERSPSATAIERYWKFPPAMKVMHTSTSPSTTAEE